jgi:CRP-like cAMP-binding protein
MIENLIKYFSSISPLTADEEKAIVESSIIKNYEKGTILLREGQIAKQTYFVLKGLVRQYSLIDGEEKTTGFFAENQWIIALNGFETEPISTQFWVCEEDCSLLIGNDESATEIFKKHPRLESIARKIIENSFAEYHKRTTNYFTDTPEQRYLRIQETNSDLIQRIPQYQLASYIGVKPESLSRIRKRLTKKA